jgi:hypothetical protein
MTARPFAPNCLKVVFAGTTADGNWANVTHWKWTGTAPTTVSADAIANQFYEAWAVQMAPYMHNECHFETVTVTDLTSDLGAVGVSSAPTAGALAGAMLPVNCTVLLNKPVSRHYRGGHPRSYIVAGDSTKLLDDRNWTSDFVALVQTAYSNMAVEVIGYTNLGCIVGSEVSLSYVTGGEPRVEPYQDLITEAVGVQRIASQRRRIGRK